MTEHHSPLLTHLSQQKPRSEIQKKVRMYWMHAIGTGAGYLFIAFYHMINLMM